LPLRIKLNIPWTPYQRQTFYKPESPEGYTDYPFADIPDEDAFGADKGKVGNGFVNGHL
jgi:hypothetical protein